MATNVGIRELRQNLSVYLRRVARGERFIVTERREPVAELAPLAAEESEYEAWLRQNKLSRPTRAWEDIPPPLPMKPGPTMTDELLEEREDQRF